MDFKVGLSTRAAQDFEEIVEYIQRDNPVAAQRFAARLVEAVESLVALPYRGSPVPHRAGVRKILVGRYAVFYRIDEAARAVQILRFWHGYRDPRRLRLT